MREEFVRYFRENESHLREFPHFPFSFLFPFPPHEQDVEWLIQLLDEEATEILKTNDVALRSDAFLFLIANLQIMVINPWLYAREQRLPRLELIELLRSDVRLIFREAVQHALNEKQEEISANSIFRIIASLGDGLKSRTEELWGP